MSDTTPTPPPPEPPHVPAGWYPDPWSPGQTRYWDGAQWTSHQSGQYQQGQAPQQQPQPQYVVPAGYAQGYGQPGYGQPLGGPPANVGFGGAIRLLFNRVGDYRGRSSRSEFWLAYLFVVIVIVGVAIVASIAFPGTVTSSSTGYSGSASYQTSDAASAILGLLYVATIVFMLPLEIRRLHDTGKPWTYILFGLIPCAGGIIMLVFLAQASEPGPNQWGPAATSAQHY